MKKCRRIYSKRKRDSSYLDNIDYNSANYLYGVEDDDEVSDLLKIDEIRKIYECLAVSQEEDFPSWYIYNNKYNIID